MIQFRGVFTAYMVSWFPDIVYAEVAIETNIANINFYGRYDFSNSSVAEFRYGYAISINGTTWTSKKSIETNKSHAAASRQPTSRI
jgi:hypothetical protein